MTKQWTLPRAVWLGNPGYTSDQMREAYAAGAESMKAERDALQAQLHDQTVEATNIIESLQAQIAEANECVRILNAELAECHKPDALQPVNQMLPCNTCTHCERGTGGLHSFDADVCRECTHYWDSRHEAIAAAEKEMK